MYTCTYAVCVTNLTVSKGVNCVLHRKLLFCCMYDDRTILPELFGVTELLFPVSQLCLHDALSGRLSWQSYRDSRSISAHPSTLLILYSTGGRQWCPAPRPPPPSSRGHWLTAAQLWVPHAGFASLRFHRAGEWIEIQPCWEVAFDAVLLQRLAEWSWRVVRTPWASTLVVKRIVKMVLRSIAPCRASYIQTAVNAPMAIYIHHIVSTFCCSRQDVFFRSRNEGFYFTQRSKWLILFFELGEIGFRCAVSYVATRRTTIGQRKQFRTTWRVRERSEGIVKWIHVRKIARHTKGIGRPTVRHGRIGSRGCLGNGQFDNFWYWA